MKLGWQNAILHVCAEVDIEFEPGYRRFVTSAVISAWNHLYIGRRGVAGCLVRIVFESHSSYRAVWSRAFRV